MAEIKVTYVDLNSLKTYQNNPKDHPQKQVHQIADSIKKFGFNNPILIDENNEIIAGHGRYLAAQQLQMETVPVIRLTHLDETQKRVYRLADNKISENGGWNKELLALEISDLEKIYVDDITITGFEQIEINNLITDTTPTPDKKLNKIEFVPEDEIITQPGDIWQLGRHKIICANSLDEESFARLLSNKRANMVIQDPPYNVKISGHVCGCGNIRHDEFPMAPGEMSSEEFTKFLTDNFTLCQKYSNDGAMQYNFMDWRHITEIKTALDSVFGDFINLCVWVKTSGGMGSLYRSQHELCFVYKNGDAPNVNNIQLGKYGRYRTNVWNYAGVNSFGVHRDDLKMHPTVKPVEMIRDAILDVTNLHDIVLDSFLGSGSTLIACEQIERTCFGIELEPKYIDTTIRRFQKLFGTDAVNISNGKTYNELLQEKKDGIQQQ